MSFRSSVEAVSMMRGSSVGGGSLWREVLVSCEVEGERVRGLGECDKRVLL